jgi:hypothetical protein
VSKKPKAPKAKTAAGGLPKPKQRLPRGVTPEMVKRVADRAEARAAGLDPDELPEDNPATRTKKAPKAKDKAAPKAKAPSEAEREAAYAEGAADTMLAMTREPRIYRAPRGRPATYKPEFAAVAKALCKRGATDFELAEEFDVTTVTIWRWSAQHDDFCNALKVGKDQYDDRIERNLAQRALGYTYNAVKVMQNNGLPVFAEYVEHMPPDPGAAKLWLSNRRPDKWREKTVTEITGKDGGPVEFTTNARSMIEERLATLADRRKIGPAGDMKVPAKPGHWKTP